MMNKNNKTMTKETTPKDSTSYGSPADWSQIIAGAGQGASSAMQGQTALAQTKRESKQSKRRTLENLLNAARRREQGNFIVGQEYSNEMNDQQSQALQQMARGFVEALQGATGRGY